MLTANYSKPMLLVTQHYNFMNNVSKTSAQSTGQSEQPGDETGATGEQQGYKSRKGWRPREGTNASCMRK